MIVLIITDMDLRQKSRTVSMLCLKDISGDEKILVALNPSEKDAACPCIYQLGDVVYSLGKPISSKEGILHVPGQSAGFVKADT